MSNTIKRQPVESSNIKSVGYDETKRILEIEFTKGSVYQYSPVSSKGHSDLVNAESIGKHFAKHIRNNTTITVEQIS